LHLKFAQHARPLIIFASSQREDLIPFFFWGQSWGNPRKKQNEYFLYFLRNAGHKIDVLVKIFFTVLSIIDAIQNDKRIEEILKFMVLAFLKQLRNIDKAQNRF